MTTTADRLARLVAPVAEMLGLSVYDVEDSNGTLRVLLDRSGGVDVDTLSDASRRISRSMDEDGAFASTSVLEVSSPGLERRLRTTSHFAGAVGERVKLKLRPGVDGDRRLDGTLTAADDDTVTIVVDGSAATTVAVSDITSARTVFEWQASPKPGKGRRPPTSASVGGSAGGSGTDGPDRPKSATDSTAPSDTTAPSDKTEATP